jgi:hypothetical protein
LEEIMMTRKLGRAVPFVAGAALALAAPNLQAQVQAARPVLTVAGASVIVLRATRPLETPPATPHEPARFRPLNAALRGSIVTSAQASSVSGRLPSVGDASVVAIRATRTPYPPPPPKPGRTAFRRLSPAARASILQAAQVTTTNGTAGSPFLLTAWAPGAPNGFMELHNVSDESGLAPFAMFGIRGWPGSVSFFLVGDGTSKVYVVDFQVNAYNGPFKYRITSKIDGSTTNVPATVDGTTQDIVVVVSFPTALSGGAYVLVFDTRRSHVFDLLGVEVTPM